jgi:Kdo2-lipid IVA lauroyltransferase/acyltransferase
LHRFLRFLLHGASKLPLSALHALGSVLGWAMYGMSPTYRGRLRENLAQAGYRDAATRREAIAAAGQMIMEGPAIWFRPHEQVVAMIRSTEGAEAAFAARAQGKGVLFLTPHLGSFEVAGQWAAMQMPVTILYRRPKMAWLDPLMREGRGRPRVRLVPANRSGVREVLAALKRGEAVGFLPDQAPGEGEGEWAEMFGRPAYTVTLAAKLAERENVACILAYARRLPRGTGYAMTFRPLPPALPGEPATRRLNRALEIMIRECPGQYLWSYNRYKTPHSA